MKLLFLFFPLSYLFCQDIGFVGDSITKSGYNIFIESHLEDYKTYNFGVEGISVAMPGLKYGETKEYQDILKLAPQHIVMMLGTNDVRPFYYLDELWKIYWGIEYWFLVDRFIKDSKVMLCTIPYQLGNISVVDRINDKIHNIAKDFGLEVADINAALGSNPEYFMEDGVHPNADGIQIMAEEVLKHLTPEYLNSDYEEQKRVGWFGCQLITN